MSLGKLSGLLSLRTVVRRAVSAAMGTKSQGDDDVTSQITLQWGHSEKITTLSEAEKMSRRRDLKLIQVENESITQRPVYKMLNSTQFVEEYQKQQERRKRERCFIRGEKHLLIHTGTTLTELEGQLGLAETWIKDMYEIKIKITGSNGNSRASEKIYNMLVQRLCHENSAKQEMKMQMGTDIEFHVIPSQKKENMRSRYDF